MTDHKCPQCETAFDAGYPGQNCTCKFVLILRQSFTEDDVHDGNINYRETHEKTEDCISDDASPAQMAADAIEGEYLTECDGGTNFYHPDGSRENYSTGMRDEYSAHLWGFTEEEIDQINARVSGDYSAYHARFLQAYCYTMLWANTREYGGDNCECDGPPENCEGHEVNPSGYQTSRDDWALQAFAYGSHDSIESDVDSFVAANWADLQKAEEEFKRGADSCGHDFALTRNGHGAGFWDRGMGDVGQRLTDASKPYGESNASIHDGGEPELDDC